MIVKLRDDRNRELIFGAAPQRVVSIVPSDTLTIADLGCAGALVGRTDYCELPADVVARLPSVGGTKNARFEAIMDLSPDLVLANQEENTRALLEKLAQAGIRVFIAFPKRVAEGLSHMAKLARVFRVEREPVVRELVGKGYAALNEAEALRASRRPLRTFCPIWMDPLMTIHGTTFISDMLDVAGAQNVFADRERRYPLAADLGRGIAYAEDEVAGRDIRYPRVTLEEVEARNPELVILPDEPHPFTEADADVFRKLKTAAASTGAIVRTSGKDVCWYGSRSVEGLPRLRALVEKYRLYS
jgi:ABC-type Fe3+-hydroxamate transport system substrate-binding protein